MTSDADFSLQPHLDYIYNNRPQRLAFQAQTRQEFDLWQTTLRSEIIGLLGLTGRQAPDHPAAEFLGESDQGTYTEQHYALDVGEGVKANIYLLVPKTPPPYKPIMVFHGHNPSVQTALGHDPEDDGSESDSNYAQALALAGYLVCAVEQRGFGERVTAQLAGPKGIRSCRHLSFEYMLQGRTLLGERCWDGMCAISYVLQRDDIVPGTLGCTGNSGGGTTALWLAAIDERLTVTVPGSYLCSFKDSILSVDHCECNYVPGILELAEMGDIAALIAPRPVRFINGELDRIYPIGPARAQFDRIKQAYTIAGAADKASLAVHPGGHGYNHAFSHEWFAQWL